MNHGAAPWETLHFVTGQELSSASESRVQLAMAAAPGGILRKASEDPGQHGGGRGHGRMATSGGSAVPPRVNSFTLEVMYRTAMHLIRSYWRVWK